MIGYPMDCPQRDERLGWFGDAQVTAEEAMFNFDMALFYKNWISGIRENQDAKTGDIPIISPRPYIWDEGVEWSSTFILMAWKNYVFYGDTTILSDNYDAMKRYMSFLDSISSNYILPMGWIGDWGSLVKGWKEGQPESVPTAFYYFNAITLEKIAQVLDYPSDAGHFAQLASAIRGIYNKKYFNDSTENYNDGSQMANAFPLYLGLVLENHQQGVLKNLIDDIVETNNTHLTTGVLGTKYMIDALTMNDRPDIAWKLATQTTYPSWYEMMKKYTTVCEFWTLKQSKNHVMMGSIDAWFYKTLAGIQPQEDHPAFKEFTIKPYIPEGLDSAKARTTTIRGTIVSSWKKSDGKLRLDVTVPFNTSALIYIPAGEKDLVLERGVPLDNAAEISNIEQENNYRKVAVKSGIYHFEIE